VIDEPVIITHGPMRAAVVYAAMGWIGTPYHHHGRVQGVGVDCAQLLVAAYVEAGAIGTVETESYPHDWHLHHSEERFLGWLAKLGGVRVQTPAPGDIAVFKYGRCFSHGAIWIGDGRVVHSYIGLGVCAHRLDEAPLHGREVQFWSMWGEG